MAGMLNMTDSAEGFSLHPLLSLLFYPAKSSHYLLNVLKLSLAHKLLFTFSKHRQETISSTPLQTLKMRGGCGEAPEKSGRPTN
jgi:hypothetical protein